MNFLTIEQLLFLHSRLIAETGGSHGVRDLNLLISAINGPQAVFAGIQLYPDLFSKAAALLESIVVNRPFVDGNTRTGIAAASILLEMNGFHLEVSNSELEEFTREAAEGKFSQPEKLVRQEPEV